MPPLLVVVSGPPGSGKTTLARELGERVHLPVIAKDDIKEMIFDTLGWSDSKWSKNVGSTVWELLFLLMDRMMAGGASVIVESNFYSDDVHRDRLLALQRRFPFDFVEVHCTSDPEVLARRYRTRERHPGHDPDGTIDFTPELAAELLDRHAALGFGTILEVDTTDPDKIDWERIVAQIREAKGEGNGSRDR